MGGSRPYTEGLANPTQPHREAKMPAILGCVLTTQCPQGSVGSQFNIEVKAGSQSYLVETIKPDEQLDTEIHGPPASVNIQSDWPSMVTFVSGEGDDETRVSVNLGGSRQNCKPFFFLADFAGACDMDSLKKIIVSNPAVDYSESGVALGKRATVSILTASKP